jgi:toxin ParE1/3/4
MSSHERTRQVILSPRARQDFIDILRYTGETWGPQQLAAYRGKIDEALQLIGRNPAIGHQRTDLPETHRAYLVGSHIIIYRDHEKAVAVVRILHQRMSLARHV